MTRPAGVCYLIVFLILAAASSHGGVRVSAGPAGGFNFGQTQYLMDLHGQNSSGSIVRLRSKLEFPVDVALAGGRIQVVGYRDQRTDWSIEASATTNLIHPAGRMLDHDWLNDTKIGYTESDQKLTAMIFDVTAAKWLVGENNVTLSLCGGLRFQRWSLKAIGFEGWYLDDMGDPYSVYDSRLGITYRVEYLLPNIGLKADARFSEAVVLSGLAAYTRAFVSDVDDHLLRNKLAEADGPGNGIIADVYLRYTPLNLPERRLYIDIGGSLFTAKANTDQIQSWYGNDPIDDFDPNTGEPMLVDNTGQVIEGIPHEITTTQFRLELKLGYRF